MDHNERYHDISLNGLSNESKPRVCRRILRQGENEISQVRGSSFWAWTGKSLEMPCHHKPILNISFQVFPYYMSVCRVPPNATLPSSSIHLFLAIGNLTET